ncbi:YheC/YheD family protein [Sporosarcina cyprini]|uniref:YheC/YheD family protein n=1 Tax=Sporosarcina cyprini TaxID=2910523 RepID=UPI001EDE72B2|nr:YheC/YheD family protein [Sporosarcina cyprini]MCG3088762.1 YheC/YheD family protein [Sporosarcina cyprini]
MWRMTEHVKSLKTYLKSETIKVRQIDERYIVTMHRDNVELPWQIASIIEMDGAAAPHVFVRWRFARNRTTLQQFAEQSAERYKECQTVVLNVTCNSDGRVELEQKRLHFRNSKWSQYALLKNKIRLQPYLPPTEIYTAGTAQQFLERYKEILLKPCIGQEGRGIIQIIRQTDDRIDLHQWDEIHSCSSFAEAWELLPQAELAKKPYIVQQKLRLAEIEACPFDIRVVVQRNQNHWMVTGMLVKVAASDFFVTNVAKELMTFEEAIPQSSVARFGVRRVKDRIQRLCLAAARQLEQVSPKPDIIGFDIGITQCGSIYILEGNYVPDLSMFHALEDKEMYRTIMQLRRQR